MSAADQAYWAGYWAHWADAMFGPSVYSLSIDDRTTLTARTSPAWCQGWADYAHQRGEENDR